jgi:thiamine-phosphate pyrophosphorylase
VTLARLEAFYPIVPDSAWLARLAPLGIRTVQLRIKDQPLTMVADEITKSLSIAQQYGLQLIINDYWREAIFAGANFVHLGQEDLAAADIVEIKAAGIRIGISTHTEAELATAMAAVPDYIALGPVYETKLKAMSWAPQGLDRVTSWKSKIGATPLVAIGGMTPDRAPGVCQAGADSIAVITDFVTNANPEARVAEWVAWSNRNAANRS